MGDNIKKGGLPQAATSPHSRWTVLVLASVVMAMGYVFWDVMSPLSTSLRSPVADGGMGWTAAEYGFYAGSYSIFNIFLLMLFVGGIILDKWGIRLTGVLATGSMLVGAVVNYYAIAVMSPEAYTDLGFSLLGLMPPHIKTQVLVASLGFALFGMGCDITGITISKVITKWFTGHELASAMGLQVALARLGTASALSFSPLIALHFGLSASLLAGVGVLLLGFVLFIAYIPMDRRFDRQASPSARETDKEDGEDERFHLRDFVAVLRNPGFWLIAFLCVFFYSSIRPFMKFASDLMVSKYGVGEATAGWIVAAIPYGTIVLTPLFGSLYDRVGHGARLMLIGCVVVTVCHLCLCQPWVSTTWFALAGMIAVGVAFSLVPSALWPSLPKIVPLKQLGTAYSIVYYLQNIGLMLVPMWIGHVVDRHTSASGQADYTVPMLIFAGFGVMAIATALLLLCADRRNHYGLEEKNIGSRQG